MSKKFGLLIIILSLSCASRVRTNSEKVYDICCGSEIDDNEYIADRLAVEDMSVPYKERIEKYGIKSFKDLNAVLKNVRQHEPCYIIPQNYQFLFRSEFAAFCFPAVKAEIALFQSRWRAFEVRNTNPDKKEVYSQAKVIYGRVPEILSSMEFKALDGS